MGVKAPAQLYPEISIVIPCLNEAKTLPACIAKAKEAIRHLDLPGEVVVADNGSIDGSVELAQSLGARVVNVAMRGYGAALCWGIRAAKGKYVVMGDGDDSYDFREAGLMVEKLRLGYDLCMGTRIRGQIMPGAMPWKNRYIGTPILTMMVNWLYRCSFSDVNCGLRAFTKEAFEQMQMESRGMEFASEMLVKASILELRSTEVPITLHKDGRDRAPHLQPWADGWRHLKYILLFAPKFVYWLPGCLLMALGTLLALALNAKPGGTPIYFANFALNDHWIVVAAVLFLVGYQIAVTGLLAYLYTLTHRLHARSRNMDTLIRFVSLERIIFFAALTFSVGCVLEFSVFQAWLSSDFGAMNAIRPAVTGMALILMGTQTLFSGFFYAVLAEKYKDEL
ncbi:glycosyltransferase family 2 protein [Lusitaniella coriacea LEGE 07157]|uniref:Glycosyltransferase family 2 protein n=1 Tax=Lusitaniella coriacea LEGE 07157 TaxID=945747 RepID=A0A8J7IW72_9CYAN|nr:glycosyltransferase family 2 protein [Lusitaniella coriacea]MBE9117808.1 glycosyltransferase family 2 protein [Lusitaniella coriacea LEGE 07157]